MSGPASVRVSEVREIARRAGWNGEKVARMVGISKTTLLRLAREGDVWPSALLEDAERVHVLARAEARRIELEAEAFELTLRGWRADVRDWRAAVSATLAPATVDAYAHHVGWLARDLAATVPVPWLLQPHQLEAWLDEHNWSIATRRKVMISLRSFFGWGVLEARCQRSPLVGIPEVTGSKPGPKPVADYPQAWHDPIQRHQDYLIAAGTSPRTRKLYRHCLMNLAQSFPDPWRITLPDLTRYCARPDLAPESRKSIRTSIRGFYRWAEETGAMPAGMRNPADKLPTVRVPRSLPRPADDDAVLAAIQRADARTRLAVLIALYTGARMAELARIHSRDIGDAAILLRGKGEQERMVPLHPSLAGELRAELRRREQGGPLVQGWGDTVPKRDGYLFPNRYTGEPMTPGSMTKLVSAVLPPGVTGHKLRHRFATQAYARDRDLRAVQELLGHAKPETTSIYAQVPGDSLVRAVENVGPVTGAGVGLARLDERLGR